MIESLEILTSSTKQEIIQEKFINKNNCLSPDINNLTLAVDVDTNIYINKNETPVAVKAKYGLQIPQNTMEIKSIVVQDSGVNVYMIYSYEDTTHYSFETKDNSLIPILSLDVPTKLNALVARQKDTIQELTQENESLKAAQQILLNAQLSFYESLVYAIPSLMPVVEGQAIIPDFIQDLYRLENNQK